VAGVAGDEDVRHPLPGLLDGDVVEAICDSMPIS